MSKDGMTAYRRLRGRDWAPRLVEFGEQVMARKPEAIEKSHPSLQPRWDQATYLGTRWGAGPDGAARKVSTVRRMLVDQRWSPSRISEITGTPNRPDRQLPQPLAPVVVVPAPDWELAQPRRKRKTFTIGNEDLREHGYTAGCPKCDALLMGREVGTAHSAQCRVRFAAIFEASGDNRVYRARLRRGEVQPPSEEPVEEE